MTMTRNVLAASAFVAGFALVTAPGPDGSFELGASVAQAQGQGNSGQGNGGKGRGGGRGAGGPGAESAAAGGGFGRGRADGVESRGPGRAGPGDEAAHGRGFGRADPDTNLDDDFDADFSEFDDEPGFGFGREEDRGAVASELKGYNAAHASPRALQRAAPGSMVGQAKDYLGASPDERRDIEDELDFSEEAILELRELLEIDEE